MADIAKITNVSINDIGKVYEVNKASITKVMGVSTSNCSNYDNSSDITSVSTSIGNEVSTYKGSGFDDDLTDGAATGAWYAYNGSVYVTTGWIGQEFNSQKKITKYKVYPYNGSERGYDPKSWTFEASSTGAWSGEEVVLHTVTNESFALSTWNEYTFQNENQYKYYRLNVSANNGSPTYLIIQEIEMYGQKDATSVSYSVGNENPSYKGAGFDNNLTDANVTGAWYAHNGSSTYLTAGWVGQHFSSPKKITKYKVYPYNGSEREHDPKSWTFEASSTGAWSGEEVVLHTVTNESFALSTWNEYTFQNNYKYDYYRLNISANNGSSTYLVIQEIEMYECLDVTSGSYNIDIDHSNIDSNLTDFPLLVNISGSVGTNSYDASDIFATVGSDYTKIKVYDSNGMQLYTEVENWDATNESAQLWVKVPTVSSSVSTRLTLEYNDTTGNVDYTSNDPTDKAIDMVVDINEEGTYDTYYSRHPMVIKESDTSYKMWYSGWDGSHYRILYATSTDGINWSNHQLVLNINQEGTYDTDRVFAPYVIKESDTSYKMWYTGSDGSHNRILYATSTNGISWSNHQMVLNYNQEGTYDTNNVYHPYVIKESSSSYKIWYIGDDGTTWRIMYATSTNGTTWSNHQMVLNINQEGTYDTDHVYDPHVIKESSSSYKMWYTGWDGSDDLRIMYATSTNGISWSNYQMVLDYNQEGTYDTGGAKYPSVIKEDSNLYKIWYNGYVAPYNRILYATSEDGKVWTKNIVNRVWDDNFAAVYHMNQDPSGGTNSIYDSTSNNNHGTPGGSMTNGDLVDGQIGKALEFDGTNDLINIGNVFDPTYYTLEAVFKTSQTGSNTGYSLLSAKHGGIVESCMYFDGDDGFNFITGFYQSGWHRDISGLKGKNDGNLHYAAATYDKVNLRSYIDDATHNTASTTTISTTTEDYRIGARWDAESNGGWWNGIIDEVRISKTARSADWIKATYHSNQDNLNYWSS